MKQKFLATLLMVGAGLLSACSLDDSDLGADEWEPKTEIWTVIIEPEFVIGNSGWGNYAIQVPQMEGYIENSNGQKNAEQPVRFCIDEIGGFSYKEGYRYRLNIEVTTTNPRIMDGPAYTFKLKEMLSIQHVGIGTEGRREVTMDMVGIQMRTIDSDSGRLTLYISGKPVDGGETMKFGLNEIYGFNYHLFTRPLDGWDDNWYSCRLRLSITPAERTIQGKHQFRVRMEKLISQRVVPGDSCFVFAPKEEFEAIESELYGNQNEI